MLLLLLLLLLLLAAYLAQFTVGNTVTFGAYEQDNNTSNGKEAIEWLVLKDEGETAMLISKYALDCKPYNEKDTSVTWETCTLRKWLNGDFYNAAFSAEEQSQIVESTISNPNNSKYNTNGGNATTDKVFLLSIDEVNSLFSSDTARQCQATAYAKANGAYVSSSNGNSWWWLRSPGYDAYGAASVYSGGSVNYLGYRVNYDTRVVRPVVLLRLF